MDVPRAILERLAIGLFVVVSLGIAPSMSRAQTGDKSDKFKQRLATALEAYKQGNYERALETFQRAEEIASPPVLQYNIARTLQKMGRCRDARNRFARVLDMKDVSDKYRTRAEKYHEQLLDQCPEKGTVRVECRPETARVVVGSEDPRSCPATVELEPGTYQLKVDADGYRPFTDEVDVESDARVDRSVDLVETTSPSQGRWKTYLAAGGLAVGLGGIAAGVATDAATARRVRRLDDAIAENDAERIRRLRSDARRARTRSTILYVSGGLVTVGAGILLVDELFESGQKNPRARQLRLEVSPTRIGVTLHW